jgi:hypothetical protein
MSRIVLGILTGIIISEILVITFLMAPFIGSHNAAAPQLSPDIIDAIAPTPVDPHLQTCSNAVKFRVYPFDRHVAVRFKEVQEPVSDMQEFETYYSDNNGSFVADLCWYKKYNVSFDNRIVYVYPSENEYILR